MKPLYIVLIIAGVLLVFAIISEYLKGAMAGWGMFGFIYWKNEAERINKTYDVNDKKNQNGIVFYGASNFRRWFEMNNDLSDYRVVNSGFGGSTDKLMMAYADRIFYPYKPSLAFFQTGSNDYVMIKGTEEEKIKQCMDYKKEMFKTFHEKLPDCKFVICSGLLLPGRSKYTSLTIKINEELKKLADETDYISFIDANEMTYDGTNFDEGLFVKDGIHLNHKGQLKWRDGYILPVIKEAEEKYSLDIRKGCQSVS